MELFDCKEAFMILDELAAETISAEERKAKYIEFMASIERGNIFPLELRKKVAYFREKYNL